MLPLHPFEGMLSEQQKLTSVGKDGNKLEPLLSVGGNGVAAMENRFSFLKHIKNTIIYNLATLPRYMPPMH